MYMYTSGDGSWSRWSAYSPCSATCGRDAVKTRSRQCDNPAPLNDGRPCDGDAQQTTPCFLDDCPGKTSIQQNAMLPKNSDLSKHQKTLQGVIS